MGRGLPWSEFTTAKAAGKAEGNYKVIRGVALVCMVTFLYDYFLTSPTSPFPSPSPIHTLDPPLPPPLPTPPNPRLTLVSLVSVVYPQNTPKVDHDWEVASRRPLEQDKRQRL